ncbi:MAG: hypothetical protein A2664_01770 [Candidatus Taylorbacteria bacterium RIFCSPHIGHO2_01_FULL_46_22b]|uniref:HIT domain-containing protein n=1 Tax=Candidatus Taylorbacteria bacterium RIFCSPHIGHO2_01_FULL_46_22b TaxID=1802301 RepID=A0A1G2M2S2_9BACT|nr:MAG: hypothetical protein A2664_01770 [Candidatus Taylorbacteria bacterium RIFCSPHIGHO2_01_FULL_46_22b]
MLYQDFLKEMKVCPFCAGKDRIIAETDRAFLTYALAPYYQHHLLVIPKRHVHSRDELTAEEKADIDALQLQGLKALKNLGHENVTFLERDGNTKNKSVEHMHFHLIPEILIGDLDHVGEPRKVLTQIQIDETVAEVSRALGK